MKRGIRLRGWLRRLPWDILAVYLAFNALVGVFGQLSITRISTDMKNHSFDDLNAVVTLKSQQLSNWLQGLLREATGAISPTAQGAAIQKILENPDDPAGQTAFQEVARQLNPSLRFAAAALVDAQGRLVTSQPQQLPLANLSLVAEVRPLLDAPWPRASDLFRGPGDRVYLVVVSPIPGIGALVLLVDVRHELFPLLREWPTNSRTAETLLVRRKDHWVMYLNDLRFRRGAALSLLTLIGDRQSPAAEAMRQRTGVMEGVDYRGVPVLAAWQFVRGSNWSLVGKVDLAEVEKPVRELAFASLLLVVALNLTSSLFLLLRLRQLARHTRAGHEALVTHYGYLARYANDIILLLDGKGSIVEANDRATEAYGYPRNELLALRYGHLTDASFESAAGLGAEHGIVIESLHRRKDGSQFPAEASIRSMQVGQERYVQCILRDISERRKAEQEKRRLEEQISRLRKQEAIGQLAGGIAHDLNNALTAIMGYAEYLKSKLPAAGNERRSAEGILAAAGRAASVTQGLLAFSEGQRMSWEILDLNALLLSCRESLLRTLGEGSQLQLEPHSGPLPVRGDAELLRLALSHLAENARQAMPQGGRFTVAATPEVSGEPPAGSGFACLRIRDTGLGMSKEVQARLFEPYFTTQGFGKGAGLGLPIVFGIVRQHGGRIEVDSENGRGSEFRLYLPLARQAEEG
jgi:PAS domain S-box-containing protein